MISFKVIKSVCNYTFVVFSVFFTSIIHVMYMYMYKSSGSFVCYVFTDVVKISDFGLSTVFRHNGRERKTYKMLWHSSLHSS